MSERDCGPCTLCCRFFGVPEMGKPAGVECAHRSDGGCAIHPTRPQSCRNFECFWLMEPSFPDDMRPDQCGVVVSFNEDHDSVVLHVDPDRPDALSSEPGSLWIEALLTTFDPLFVVCGEDRMMIRRSPQEP